jgi:hypothetical protein
MSSCTGRLDLAMSILETFIDTIGNIVYGLVDRLGRSYQEMSYISRLHALNFCPARLGQVATLKRGH